VGVAAIGRRPAIFLDRDGVLTELVWNERTRERESPHSVADLRLRPGAVAALQTLARSGYELFVVSNQPSYAKGKVGLETLREIARVFERRLAAAGIALRRAYYCFHHPEGVVRGYGRRCRCRKPSPYFLRVAARSYDIDLRRSWFVGDRSSDVECGRSAGCRTILITSRRALAKPQPAPDRMAQNVGAAARMIQRATRRAAEGNA
jgi:D-glycero-D-manno-heptose 1,7-bisphosphate phosphatase